MEVTKEVSLQHPDDAVKSLYSMFPEEKLKKSVSHSWPNVTKLYLVLISPSGIALSPNFTFVLKIKFGLVRGSLFMNVHCTTDRDCLAYLL